MMNLDPTPYKALAIGMWALGMFLFLSAGKRRTVTLLAHATFLSGILVLAGFTWNVVDGSGQTPCVPSEKPGFGMPCSAGYWVYDLHPMELQMDSALQRGDGHCLSDD